MNDFEFLALWFPGLAIVSKTTDGSIYWATLSTVFLVFAGVCFYKAAFKPEDS